jgi:hypothetical protein
VIGAGLSLVARRMQHVALSGKRHRARNRFRAQPSGAGSVWPPCGVAMRGRHAGSPCGVAMRGHAVRGCEQAEEVRRAKARMVLVWLKHLAQAHLARDGIKQARRVSLEAIARRPRIHRLSSQFFLSSYCSIPRHSQSRDNI